MHAPLNFSLEVLVICSLWLWEVQLLTKRLFKLLLGILTSWRVRLLLLLRYPKIDNAPQYFSVNERPLLVVVSSDLRSHPVGRFWLPIARQLRTKFQVISVAGHPRDRDPLRDELKSLSDEWWPLEADGLSSIAEKIRGVSLSLLIDLGGHTADNHPALLCRRLATVQATYLGFYGPTYARCCDWWIVDQVLERWISTSYPGAERLWALPGPSLCYVPELHSVSDPETISYQESNYLIYGSFNHTRKLTRDTQERFGAVLSASPDAVLQFRSHSFHDPAVRRYFSPALQRCWHCSSSTSTSHLTPLPLQMLCRIMAVSTFTLIAIPLVARPLPSIRWQWVSLC